MISALKESLWKQFGASIDMLGNAILLWPDAQWDTDRKFFYMSWHCLLFLDYYLSIPPKNFSSPLPFTIPESGEIPEDAVDDLLPNRIYSKKELLDYLQSSRAKCRQLIESLTEEKMNQRWIDEPDQVAAQSVMQLSVFEILLYNMRHVQHHAGQLNVLLRQQINDAPGWVAQAGESI